MSRSDDPSAPEALREAHAVNAFDCGEPTLDEWLRRRARVNEASGASRTFALCRDARVIGYYALAAGAIASSEAPGRLRRNMPDPIPVFVLGRLAIDRSEQGRGFGSLLLRDALLRTFEAARSGGVAGILVHAILQAAKGFYLKSGFTESPSNPMVMVARMRDLGLLVDK